MVYSYGESPVHGYATPDDDTPLDEQSWATLVDGIGVGVPFACASQAEQDAYLAAIGAAGFGPDARNIIRVCRTDLDRLVMSNDGTGWLRDSGGSLRRSGFANAASALESGGTLATRGNISIDLPGAADVDISAVVIGRPPDAGDWAFYAWLEDGAGRELTPRITYGNMPRMPYPAILNTVALMPAGASQIRLKTLVNLHSAPVQFAHVVITANYG